MSTTATTDTAAPAQSAPLPVARTRWGRLVRAQTAIDFWGRRRVWVTLSLALLAITGLSLWQQGLQLGIDFEGGVAWDVPAGQLSVDDARELLRSEGLDANNAKIQERRSDSGDIVKVQVEDQPEEVRVRIQERLAEAAGVDAADVSVASVSASWGEEITRRAVIALVVFLSLIAVYISLRFEWRMAVTALVCMAHDVAVSVGIYSVFRFEVTPATVVAFLTVLGYSLYDSIVVFDRLRDNEKRIAAAGLSAGDAVNASMNQVLLRSINTTLASALPVASLLFIGSGLFGQVTLREFAIALLVGMLTGAYSSIFLATPLLGWLKASSPTFAGNPRTGHLTGEDLRAVVVAGPGGLRAVQGRHKRSQPPAATVDGGEAPAPARTVVAAPPERLLTHPPRPRKKKRR